MIRVGIMDGDILVVDRSEVGCHGDIVVACLDGDFNVKTLRVEGMAETRRVWLVPENEAFQPVEIESERDFKILGVVISVLISRCPDTMIWRKDHLLRYVRTGVDCARDLSAEIV